MPFLAQHWVSWHIQLLSTPSPYTKDQSRAYKSLDGYNFATSGWVNKVQVVRVHQHAQPTVLVWARVRHSQRLSGAPLRPWVTGEGTGLVICAHCSCMAGLGEACCHISAVLFTLELNTNWRTACLVLLSRALGCHHHFNLFRIHQCLGSSLQHWWRRLLPSTYQLAAVNHSRPGILLHQENKCKISSSNWMQLESLQFFLLSWNMCRGTCHWWTLENCPSR